jgi:hypothetical protein
VAPEPEYPRPLSARERSWLALLLPTGRPGYDALRDRALALVVLGVGRWGGGDLILGPVGGEIDMEAGSAPVISSGMIEAAASDGAMLEITLALHEPGDEGMIELRVAMLRGGPVPDDYTELRRWSYASWLPGEPCPASGGPVREVPLDTTGTIRLAISPRRRVLWLHDPRAMTNTPVPVTNFHNELMLAAGVRDPAIALDPGRLFSALDEFSDGELRSAFRRYNMSFRKIDPERLAPPLPEAVGAPSLLDRIRSIFRGRG